jgi:hypothetical protein
MKDLKHIKRFNESEENLNISDVRSSKKINDSYKYDKKSYKIVEDFLKEKMGDYVNPLDQEDLTKLLIEFGEKIWIHLSEQGWGVSSLNGYEEWLRNE